MVAVVSGSGLGLFGSSAAELGGAGIGGNAKLGRGGDRVYVNSATGNLVVQSVDETLTSLGIEARVHEVWMQRKTGHPSPVELHGSACA